ncbi:ClpP/crotonase [Cutaneotrichosporon oleaginosum]|uniref:ClpP/crotonase n=1 Tax=Cutaneotrichosporon oleaginosum TaxID=879819 RepID=A0A0J0XRV7_9TREE|nr:ClpP/crotonase [Cutaneotrichosporon oleaginosum]KLT43833.1 ClpP/crotonase [Cutaneotrichosporon oleaginosum]TXT06426.1 hypothetical protein COLE_05757 [Cutaneotrichosporon oleaginosum]
MPNVILSRPSPTVWQLTLNSGPDNRLRPDLLGELSAQLDVIEAEWRKAGGGQRDEAKRGEHKGAGAVVITSAFPKFFSNGLDPVVLMSTPNFFEDVFDPIVYRLMTFPLVTVAAVNGHAFAGGMLLALACDFRVMNGDKGMMSMNELLIGLPLPNSFGKFLQMRLSPTVLRDTMLAKRWKQTELLAHGLIDEIVPEAQVVPRAIEIATQEGTKVGLGSWGAIKDALYHDVIDASRSGRAVTMPQQDEARFLARMKRQAAKL